MAFSRVGELERARLQAYVCVECIQKAPYQPFNRKRRIFLGHLSKEDFMKTHPRKTMVFLAPLFLAIPEERWLSKQSGIRATGIDPA